MNHRRSRILLAMAAMADSVLADLTPTEAGRDGNLLEYSRL
jgi:hypothetical protein